MRSPIRLPLIAMLATAAIVLASCGSGSSKASPASTTDPATASTTEPTTTEAGNDKPTEEEVSPEFCNGLIRYNELMVANTEADQRLAESGKQTGAADLTRMKTYMAESSRALNDAAVAAPSVIKGDTEYIAKMWSSMNDEIQTFDSVDDWTASNFTLESAGFNDAKGGQANKNVGRFASEHCDLGEDHG